MENTLLSWFRSNHDVVGFLVAALIFLTTIVLVSRKLIGFWITLLLLLFALISGLTISNQDFLKQWMLTEKGPPSKQIEEAPKSAP